MSISIDPGKCTGCRICELVCSFAKFSHGKFNLNKTGIKVVNLDQVGFSAPVVCILCKKPGCIEACPTGALMKTTLGTILVDEERCDGCGLCIDECIIGAINFDEEKGLPIICDLCNGSPVCVEWCPTGALTFNSGQRIGKKALNYAIIKAKPYVSKWKIPQDTLDWYKKFL